MAQHNDLSHLTLIMSALLLSCFLHILASSNHSKFRAEMKKPHLRILRLSDNNLNGGFTNCSLLEELNISQSLRSLISLPSNFNQGKFPMSITNRESLEVNENRGFDSWELSESFTGLTKIQVTAQAVFSGWVLLMSVLVQFLLPEALEGVREAGRRIAGTATTWLIPSESVTACVNLLPAIVTAQVFLLRKVPIKEMSARLGGKHWLRKRYMFLITCLALLNLCCANLQPKDIFILAGQSNMSGRGGAIVNNTWDGLVPPESEPNPFIFRFNKNFTWEEALEPLHFNIGCTIQCGVGPGMSFANSLLKLKPSMNNIGLVPCAHGGIPIVQWSRTGHYYIEMITRARASLKQGGVLRALLWYQGESDTATLEDALSYRARFEKFVRDVRVDLVSPTLPIIEVALASGKYFPYIKIVREAQLGLHLPHMQCVDAWGLKLEPDNLHLTTHSQVLLGKKLAQAFISCPY